MPFGHRLASRTRTPSFRADNAPGTAGRETSLLPMSADFSPVAFDDRTELGYFRPKGRERRPATGVPRGIDIGSHVEHNWYAYRIICVARDRLPDQAASPNASRCACPPHGLRTVMEPGATTADPRRGADRGRLRDAAALTGNRHCRLTHIASRGASHVVYCSLTNRRTVQGTRRQGLASA